MKYTRVENKEHLVRDFETNAIINTDRNAYEAYKLQYKKKLHEKQNSIDMEQELKSLRNDIDEIKNLLRGLTNESK